MTTVVTDLNNAIDMRNISFGDTDDAEIEADSNSIVLDYGGGYYEVFGGSFTYSGEELSGGTLTSYAEVEDGVTLVTVTGSIPAMTFYNWYKTGNVTAALNTLLNGADTVKGSNFGDYLFARAGNDLMYGYGGADTLLGEDGGDTIYGGTGNDILNGGEGSDFLDGESGADTLIGGMGDDWFIVDSVGDSVSDTGGYDRVYSFVSYTLLTGFERLLLTGTANNTGTGNSVDNYMVGNSGSNMMYGLAGADFIDGAGGNDTLDGGAGADDLNGGLGDDTYIFETAGDKATDLAPGVGGGGVDHIMSSVTANLALALGVEHLTLTGSLAINGLGSDLANIITGNTAVNTLTGGAGNDTLNGLGGADIIDGGTGADAMSGGYGADVFTVDNIGDTVTETADPDIDKVNASISFALGAYVENLTLTGSDAINGTGNSLANLIEGNEAANVLLGDAGADQLKGFGGADRLDGGLGADTMTGGWGDDTYVVESLTDLAVELAGQGTDLVEASITHTLAKDVENLTLVGDGAINGTGNTLANLIKGNGAANTLSGGAGIDTLAGFGGNDVLDGGAGIDTLTGGLGDDVYIVDDVAEVLTELAGEGRDEVEASLSWTLADNFEDLTLLTGALNGTGNGASNIIVGNTSANQLSGLDGADSLFGGLGNDQLNGGTGGDDMHGGAGNDIYFVDSLGDVVVEAVGEGADTIFSSLAYTLGANLENLTLTGAVGLTGTGNELNNTVQGNDGDNLLYGLLGSDTLVGGAGNDTLDGGAGADTMRGGLGDDFYLVDAASDKIAEVASQGYDRVESSVTYVLTQNIEKLTLTGSAAINGTGNISANLIIGNSAANTLKGEAGADTLEGGLGDDRLDGGTGNDVLRGGAGNDLYFVDSKSDVIEELAGGGLDAVSSSSTYTLAAEIETLTLTGVAAINGTGNGGANTITGNAGDNNLWGGAGADILRGNDGADLLDGGLGVDNMTGGLGDDTYIVDDATEIVKETLDQGLDTVKASVTYALTSHVENLTLTGTAVGATGNTLGNTIIGNASANVITGGGGADVLRGGSGADTFVYKALTDSEIGARDLIADYASADKLDLSLIDANALLAGNQAFARLAGDGEFTAAGQFRLTYDGASTTLALNTDGDADAEMSIVLTGNWTAASVGTGWIL
jgi:Ca2+-binding RTX toxin-like protein